MMTFPFKKRGIMYRKREIVYQKRRMHIKNDEFAFKMSKGGALEAQARVHSGGEKHDWR